MIVSRDALGILNPDVGGKAASQRQKNLRRLIGADRRGRFAGDTTVDRQLDAHVAGGRTRVSHLRGEATVRSADIHDREIRRRRAHVANLDARLVGNRRAVAASHPLSCRSVTTTIVRRGPALRIHSSAAEASAARYSCRRTRLRGVDRRHGRRAIGRRLAATRARQRR